MSKPSKDYARGYWAGSKKSWPEHRPPSPPHPMLKRFLDAGQKLRDEADMLCATSSEGDHPGIETAIDEFDEALTEFGQWVRGGERGGHLDDV